jgi:hypothetical protein
LKTRGQKLTKQAVVESSSSSCCKMQLLFERWEGNIAKISAS